MPQLPDAHDHGHDHPHAEISQTGRPSYYEIMETAVRELLIEKRLIGPEEIRRQIEVLDSRTPALGAKVVARAWVDPEFRARLLADGRGACEEFGITFYDDTGSKKTRPCPIFWVGPFAPATRVPSSDCCLTGTSSNPIGRAPSSRPARFSPSLARSSQR